MRIRANIPVIMMGETGCGKTFLIKKLSEMLNYGKKNKMKILNIHAGITDKDIINFIEKEVIKDALILEEKDKEEKKLYDEKNQIYIPEKLWVFLDEINTCKSMGLISELMCKHTYQGNPLPSNIVFIAACNPYRKGKISIKKTGLNPNQAHKEVKNLNPKEIEKMKRDANSSLVYTVNPMPHSLLNFVFDFGNVEGENEIKYIKIMILDVFKQIYFKNKVYDEENPEFKKIYELGINMIKTAQNFIREKNGKSSVSLREIKRFNIFYKFFYEYLNNKKNMNFDSLENRQIEGGDIFYKNKNEFELQVYSIILSIFVCYYLRITEMKIRNEFSKKMDEILNDCDEAFKSFMEIPLKEEKFILKNIKLEKGIASNRALLDNIFSLFIAINNKVPIFIVGKPGCSKSLSVHLIQKAMKGKSSNNQFFKNYPKIILNSYQGSMASTSQGIENVFKKARNILKNIKNEEDKKNTISMIFFDEMGLAEYSPNNPLKVIHSQLEYENENENENNNENENENKNENEKENKNENKNENKIENENEKKNKKKNVNKKVAFVGISNWSLDASKMNRGMYLSIPEPEIDDVKETSLTIGTSYDEYLSNNYKLFFQNLGVIYYKYKNFLGTEHTLDGKEDFHGNRDFYHLVKIVSRLLIEKKKTLIDQNVLFFSAVISIERNFGGLMFNDIDKTTSIQVIKKIFNETNKASQDRKKYDVLDRIKENINDIESRYLLVISKSSVSSYLVSSVLKDLNKDFNYYIGSQFQNDLQSEEYTLKILNKIQLHMEQGKVLILKNLESVYPALYDLFNQNFTEVSNKNYARIAIGSTTNAFSLVDDNFRCIVNVSEDQIDEEEPPFLNRFEKHIFSFEYLLKKDFVDESYRIHKVLNELTIFDKNIYKAINYDLKSILINLDLEEIQGIIYNFSKTNNNINDFMGEVIKKISLILPQDIILFQKFIGFKSNYPDISEMIIKEYSKGEHNNLGKFLEKMNNLKNVVYTFSNVLDSIDKIEVKNNILGDITNQNIKEIKISSFNSENEFEKEFDDFLESDNFKICIIKFNSYERNFLNYIKFFVENKEKNYYSINQNKNKKAFIFTVHLSRIFNSDKEKLKKGNENADNNIQKETISLLSEYYQIFIDNLNGTHEIKFDEIIESEGTELLKKFFDFDLELNKNIFSTLSYMKYEIPCPKGDLKEDTYVQYLINYLSDNKDLREKINDCIKKQMNNEENIIMKFLKSDQTEINQYDIDMISVIHRFAGNYYKQHLNKLYFKSEQDQFFSTLLSLYEINNMNKNNSQNKNSINDEENDKKEQDNNQNKEKLNEDKDIKDILIKNTIDAYLENLNFTYVIEGKNKKEINVVEEIGYNILKINLGLNLPGIKPIINKIINKFRIEILRIYKINENSLRGHIETEEIQRKKDKYKQKLKDYNEIILVELIKNELLSKITTDDYKKKSIFYQLFLEDYYTLFIDNYLSKDIKDIDYDSIKKLLKLMVKNKFNDTNDPIKLTANAINWIEYYSIEISSILKMFSMVNNFTENLYEQIEEIINNKKIKYENSNRCKEYTSIVNQSIFFGMESILRALNSNQKVYFKSKNEKELSKLLNTNNEILQLALKIEGSLDLFTKEAFTLQEIIEIISCLTKNNKNSDENIAKIINYFSEESRFIIEDNENELIDVFGEFYKFLEDLLGKEKSFIEMMIVIFKNEHIKITKEKFREKLLEIIITKDEFIYKNIQLFKFIISIDITPDGMLNNKRNILEKNSTLFKAINNSGKLVLEETIINLYEIKIIKYFNNIVNLNFEEKANLKTIFKTYYTSTLKKEEKEPLIIYDLSFDIFKECVLELDEYLNRTNEQIKERNQNDNLFKLYAISYIKIYLNKFATFIYEKEQYIGDFKHIIEFINGSYKDNKFRIVLKIYFFKVFFNLMKKDWDKLINYSFPKKGIDFYTILIEENNQNIKDKTSIKSIITEEILPNEKIYEDYPLLKYFTYTEYRTRNDFMKKLESDKDYKIKYPLLYEYIKEQNKDSNVRKLFYLYYYNEFCNYMIDYYSYKISREEAKNSTLENELIFKDKSFSIKFNNFCACWKAIGKEAVIYQKIKLEEKKEYTKSDKLIYFLNDINEQGNGMYLAAGYEQFINWQNIFLQYLIDNSKNNPNIEFYLNKMKKKIPICEANTSQTVLISSCFSGSYYEDFDDLINTFSRRDIFNNDGTINYLNYNSFIYDISSIEGELAKLILPGKCLFEDSNILNCIIYWGEGLKGGKSKLLQKFCKKYEQSDLTEDEKQTLIDYIKKPNVFKKFFGSIQLLIFYLINKDFTKDNKIIDILQTIPDYLQLDLCFLSYFNEEAKQLTASKIMFIFSLVEHFCFKDLSSNLIKEYNEDINEEIINKINTKLLNNENNNLPIKELASAVRRFISRYLVGKNKKADIEPKSLLLHELKRPDLWNKKIENLEELLSDEIKEYKLTVGQCFKFYELIKEKDEKEINFHFHLNLMFHYYYYLYHYYYLIDYKKKFHLLEN